MGKSFPLNFQTMFEINTTPDAASPTWARVAGGINSVTQSNNENVDQSAYLDGDGYGSSDVIGAQKTLDFSGHRLEGDSAQDYIFDSLQDSLGDARKTQFRITDAKGKVTSGNVTVCNIEDGGGDANGKSAVSFSVHFNGKPSTAPAAAAPALTVTVAAGSAAGTTKATVTAGTGNTLAYALRGSDLAPNAGAYLFGLTSYVSGSDIKAAAGQVLNLFELDANGRVVKANATTLTSSDIKA